MSEDRPLDELQVDALLAEIHGLRTANEVLRAQNTLFQKQLETGLKEDTQARAALAYRVTIYWVGTLALVIGLFTVRSFLVSAYPSASLWQAVLALVGSTIAGFRVRRALLLILRPYARNQASAP